MKKDIRKLLLVTGLSGAGLSTVLNALEDIGYKAVDNLPLSLIDPLLSQKEGKDKSVAIGIDSRTWDYKAADFLKKFADLRRQKDLEAKLVFINCQDNILQQRFTETRRVHPLAVDRPVKDGILRERQIMKPVQMQADIVIDTTGLKVHDLRRYVAGQFGLKKGKGIRIFVASFGFRNGLPLDADMVFDARFLDNPHYDLKLRPLSGLDAAVGRHIRKDRGYAAFLKNMTCLLKPLFPRYDAEGKNYLTIAVGCTGGRHRSVFVADQLYRWIKKEGYAVDIHHRDMDEWALRHPVANTNKGVKRRKRK